MARTLSWLQNVGSGGFDVASSWADITTGTPAAASAAPGSADAALFEGVTATVGIVNSDGMANTIAMSQSAISLAGAVQFGSLALSSATLDVVSDGTLLYQPSFQPGNQIAVEIGADGLLNVTGDGASVSVQNNGNAFLQIEAGGTVAVGPGGSAIADTLDLAGVGGAAVAIVDGGRSTPGGALQLAAQWIPVGDGGNGALTVQNGALAQSGILTVGYGEGNAAGSGTLLVQTAGQLAIGSYADFGDTAGDVGSGTIDGTGSSMSSAGLFVGEGGSGSLTVRNQATLTTSVEADDATSFAGAIANEAGASGAVIVTGVNSTWNLSGRLDVGDGGSATLDVLAGGAVLDSVTPVSVSGTDGTSYEASVSLGTANVIVQGSGSTLDAQAGPIYVGNQGTANVSVADGGGLSAVAPAADFAALVLGLNGGSGALTVSGPGSQATALGQLDVGGSNAGTLLVADGATAATGGQAADTLAGLSLGDGTGSSGSATIDGAGSVLTNSGRLDVGRSGTGALTVSNGATLATRFSGTLSTAQPASVVIGASAGASGTVTVGSDGAALTTPQDMIVGAGATGVVHIDSGGRVAIGGNLGIGNALGAAVSGGGSGLVTLAGGTLTVGGTLALGDAISDYSGSGTLNVTGGATVSVAGAATIAADSTLTLARGGTLDVASLGGGTVDFAGAGTLRLHAAASGTGLIVGLDGGIIDMAGLAVNNAAYDSGDLTVDLAGSLMIMPLAAPPPQGSISLVPDGMQGTDVILPCFAAGTRLAGPNGPVPVENVRAGDRLLTAAGHRARVVWAGQRTLECRRHLRPADVYPVRVSAGAFSEGVPARDVLLSPDHALFVEGSLIPVRYLVNGTSVAQETASRITYCHVELAEHDVVLAEGLPCESFLDTGNKSAFAAHCEATMLHPDFARAVWAEKGCAPLVLEGPALERARRHFLGRAAALGHRRTRQPGLRILAGNRPLPAELAGSRWQVALPEGVTEVRLASRTWVPAHMRPRENDTRLLGVAVSRLTLDGRDVALDSPALAQGWHPAEPDWRWTDGDGVLPVARARVLAFDLAMVGEYWATPSRDSVVPGLGAEQASD